MSEITKMADGLDAFIRGLEPTWRACERCGAETARATCWECERIESKTVAARERYAQAEASVFAGYRVRFSESALAERKVPCAMVAKARQCLSHPHVVIRGIGTGIGKSILGGSMFLEYAAKHDIVARRISAYALSGNAFELDPVLITADLILIDDLGNERQLASNLVPELCEMRRGNGRGLWVTTALDAAGLAQRYGENIARRVPGGARVLDFDKGAT